MLKDWRTACTDPITDTHTDEKHDVIIHTYKYAYVLKLMHIDISTGTVSLTYSFITFMFRSFDKYRKRERKGEKAGEERSDSVYWIPQFEVIYG